MNMVSKIGVLAAIILVFLSAAAAQTQLKELGDEFNILTNGYPIHVNDTSMNQDIIRFLEGGDVNIPNGNLNVSGNVTMRGSGNLTVKMGGESKRRPALRGRRYSAV